MPKDPVLLERLRRISREIFPHLIEKNMFGGAGFFVNGNYAFGASDRLVVRVGPERFDDALAQPHASVMDMTGRPMKGWVFVDAPGIATDEQLRGWMLKGVDFASTLPPK